jgi:YfiH family protein
MSLPAVPDTFEWIQQSWGAALRCIPLQAIAPHLFTTRQLALSTQEDWRTIAEAIGAASVQTLTQVHGRGVFVLRSPKGLRHSERREHVAQGFSPAIGRPEADVLVSNNPKIAIAVRAADCVPILIADPKTGAVAAVHAGWRGTAAAAAPAALEAMSHEFGARPADLIAAIGPSIGPCCYEVGTELVDAFAAAGHARHLIDRWFLAPPPPRGESDRPTLRLDTWAANRDQLMLAGVDEQNIHMCGLCTANHLELFPSYRVERDEAGRIAGIIKANGKK